MSYKSERSFERSMIPHEYIEELTRRTDIVELVGSYVQLKRKGLLWLRRRRRCHYLYEKDQQHRLPGGR